MVQAESRPRSQGGSPYILRRMRLRVLSPVLGMLSVAEATSWYCAQALIPAQGPAEIAEAEARGSRRGLQSHCN